MCIYPPAFLPITGSCSYYIKVLAIPQTFLDTTAGSVWIVLSLSSLDYIYLAISWDMESGEMLNSVLTKKILVDRLGYPSMTAHYLKVRVNY